MCYAGGPYCYGVAKKRMETLEAELTAGVSEDRREAAVKEFLQARLEYYGTRKGQAELTNQMLEANDNRPLLNNLTQLKSEASLLRRKQVKEAQARGEKDDKDHALETSEEAQEQDFLERKPEDDPERPTYNIPADRMEEAQHRIDKANRKLERNGIEERFTIDVEYYYLADKDGHGMPSRTKYARIVMNKPSISHEGYSFLAVVDREQDKLVTRVMPGNELQGWKPDSMKCEHCGKVRSRNKSYLIKTPEGDTKQVGSSCITPYLGVRPQGLWALGYEMAEEKDTDDLYGDDMRGRRSGGSELPVDDTLSYALAMTNGGQDYVSKSRAEYSGDKATANRFNDIMYSDRKLKPHEKEERKRIHELAKEYRENGEVTKLKKLIEEQPGGTDYIENLKTVASNRWVSNKSTALLLSSVTLLKRQRKREQIEKSKPKFTPGFAGEPGASMKGRKAKVISNTIRRTANRYSYHGEDIERSQIVFEDEEGHQMVWWASKAFEDIEAGQEVTFSGGTVKKHDEYRGTDQTVLTRLKFSD